MSSKHEKNIRKKPVKKRKPLSRKAKKTRMLKGRRTRIVGKLSKLDLTNKEDRSKSYKLAEDLMITNKHLKELKAIKTKTPKRDDLDFEHSKLGKAWEESKIMDTLLEANFDYLDDVNVRSRHDKIHGVLKAKLNLMDSDDILYVAANDEENIGYLYINAFVTKTQTHIPNESESESEE